MLIDREEPLDHRTSNTWKLATAAIGLLLVTTLAYAVGAPPPATGAENDEPAAAQSPPTDEKLVDDAAVAVPDDPTPPVNSESDGKDAGRQGLATASAANKKKGSLGRGQIRAAQELFVPAGTAGMITKVAVRRGARVKRGDLLVQLDDRREQMALQSAMIEFEKDKLQESNDIDLRYAKAVFRVAEQEYVRVRKAEKRVKGSIPPDEVAKKMLDMDRARLQVEQSEATTRYLRSQLDVSKVAVEAAKLELSRRRITAPFDGVVTELKAVPGGWIKAGERVCNIIQLDRVKIDIYVSLRVTNQLKLSGRKVLIEAHTGLGKTQRFPAVVVYVSPVADPTRALSEPGTLTPRHLVTVEADNPQWLLRPGMNATVILPKK